MDFTEHLQPSVYIKCVIFGCIDVGFVAYLPKDTCHISFVIAISETNLNSIFQQFLSYSTESKYSSSQEAEFC